MVNAETSVQILLEANYYMTLLWFFPSVPVFSPPSNNNKRLKKPKTIIKKKERKERKLNRATA